MTTLRFIFTFTVIFLFFDQLYAFDNITEGKEYNFKYHLSARSYIKRGIKTTRDYHYFGGDLTIKALPDNWLECHFSNVDGQGVPVLDELKNIFMVKVNEGKVIEVNSTGKFTEAGNAMKKDIIQEIVMDRSNIVRFVKEGHHDKMVHIDMPIGGKCEVHLKEEMKNDKKYYQAKSFAPHCVLKDEVLTKLRSLGVGDPLEDSSTSVTLIYDTANNKQIGLRLYNGIRMWNGNNDIVLLNERIEVQYLG